MNHTKNFYVIEVIGWAKHNEKMRAKSSNWFRMSANLFNDHEFLTLSSGAKFVWLAICCHRALSNPKPCSLSARLISSICHIKPESVPKALSELEEREWIQILAAPPSRVRAKRTNVTNVTNERFKASEESLTKLHKNDTLDSSTSQIAANPQKKSETKTKATWESFSNAYRKRYGSDPVRNATTNSQMSNVVKRIGEAEAPEVVAFYLSIIEQYYLNQCHSVGILLRDCEKIRTMWANGTRTTNVDAKTAHWREQARAIDAGEL